MNYLIKSVSSIARLCIGHNIQGNASTLLRHCTNSDTTGNTSLVRHLTNSNAAGLSGLQLVRGKVSLYQMHRRGPLIKKRKRARPLDGNPFLKGVVLKTLIKKPRKPNSANRKCVLVRLSNGKEMTAYIPGIGHNLQEHNIVLCRVGRTKDLPGVKIKCVRGKYDLPHPVKRTGP
ncbi:40S ribosomal protein S12, mitochondrial isoform X2 [Belonocnema kinseyi]|uniref:40S ribosomal protein S12, mitochondrial isoform X2 n=1 Tax=Belonocnema kinseyi TaxID=2817044 RepID=UPI00143DCB75|nr:40S ribosomal protein S12, mitochondrial isoform X2 [Belonocnema kinseyi]